MNHKKIETGNGQVGIGNTQAVSVFFHASSRLQAKMVAANIQPLMLPIDPPFVGDWDINQVFQLTVGGNEAFAYGSYDLIQEQFIVQIGQGGPFFTVAGNFTLGHLLNHMGFALNDLRFTLAGWAGRGAGGGRPQMPALNDTQALLDLSMLDLRHVGFAASFDVVVV